MTGFQTYTHRKQEYMDTYQITKNTKIQKCKKYKYTKMQKIQKKVLLPGVSHDNCGGLPDDLGHLLVDGQQGQAHLPH